MWLLGCVWRCECALCRVWSRALVSLLALQYSKARDVYIQADIVYGMVLNIESRGSWEMYYLARRGKLTGF
jgi:hypothetical protein